MAIVTLGRLAEEIGRIIYGGNIPDAGKVSLYDLKYSIGQACNQLLKADYFQVNARSREMIPNGTMLGTYENIAVSKYKNKSQAILPIKPVKLPRGMGIFSIFDPNDPDNEYIPLQMGQAGLIKSQPLLSDLLGQVGYTNYGMQILFTRDISSGDLLNPTTVSMRLAIMDISQYGDLDPLPILPEMELPVKTLVLQMYNAFPISDKIVDPGHKEKRGEPTEQQAQT